MTTMALTMTIEAIVLFDLLGAMTEDVIVMLLKLMVLIVVRMIGQERFGDVR